MDRELARCIGERVRFCRVAADKTQPVIAGLAGISVDYLYQIERGTKLPTVGVLVELARVLEQPIGVLLNNAPATASQPVPGAAGDELRRALTLPVVDTGPVDLSGLNDSIGVAWHTWQTSPQRYSRLVRDLPRLITAVEWALRTIRSDDEAGGRRYLYRCAADLYALVRSVTKRLGRVDLALLAADRAIRAGEAADDPLRLAVSRWNLAQVLLADEEPESAETVALHGAQELEAATADDDLDAVALRGSLLLVAAIAAARRGDRWVAHDRVRLVEPLARRTGERNTLWTAFGPTNVKMFAVSVAVETGDTAEGLRLAEQVDHDSSPSIERRVAFLIDQAKGYEQRRDFAGALMMVSAAERQAPEDVRHRPAARAVLSRLVQRGRRTVAGEAARLATRIGVPL
ncbi:helix-turn-helix domain-containing protein [Actinokineospora spheciospongiae]|uniref:helix-turn-helix domain-containing protein n=1 Tax=Actinokineospora spheciospongiae TaxID=909613 RepID=UPI000D8EB109|nr:helix-turn-helix transcriptional regulator [Actinokineospora spheciospongiae]PWW64116.1 helix-turn-helix protein [Actinokineospora spheciospongiae]